MSTQPNPANPQDQPDFDPTEPIMPDTVRPTFYDEVESRCRQFGQDLLKLIPELEGLMFVPSWKNEFDDKLFHGIVMGRGGEGLRPPTETMHMAAQAHKALAHVQNQSFQFLQWLDEQIAKKLTELHQLRGEGDGGDQQPQPQERSPGGGATPASPGESQD